MNTDLSFDLTTKSCQSVMTLPDSPRYVSIAGLEERLSEIDSSCGDGIVDPGPNKNINKSINWDLPVSDAVRFYSSDSLGAFRILTTEPFASVGIKKSFIKLENVCVLTPNRRC